MKKLVVCVLIFVVIIVIGIMTMPSDVANAGSNSEWKIRVESEGDKYTFYIITSPNGGDYLVFKTLNGITMVRR